MRRARLPARLLPRPGEAATAGGGAVPADHAVNGQRGDPDFRLDRHSRPQGAGQSSAGGAGFGAGQAVVQRDGGGHRARQHLRTIHGAADHGLDRAYLAEPGGGRAEPRCRLVPDVPAGDPAIEPTRADLGLPACLQPVDQRLCHAGADGQRTRANGRSADLRRGAGLLQLAGRLQPLAHPVLVTAALMFGALFATRHAGRREKAS
jgi:hypothetical protein